MTWSTIAKCLSIAQLFFTRLESVAWSKQGFWHPSFFRKHNLWSLCCVVRTKVGFLCLACMEKGKSVDMRILHPSNLFYRFPFLQESNEGSTTLCCPLKQSLHKSQFLEKLSCQKPYLDQARLSSLVNKEVWHGGAVDWIGLGWTTTLDNPV